MTHGRRAYSKVARFLFLKTNLLKTGLIIAILIIVLIFVSTPSASNVTITNSRTQAKLGIYMVSYYENSNAQLSNTPVIINTQTSIPATSGSFYLQPGTSAYLWSTQYTSSKTVPAGKMTLDMWAGSTPRIDGQVSTGFNSNTGSVALTTTQANDIIYVVVSTQSTPTVTISGSSLTWQTRASVANGASGKVWTFYAIASSPLSSSTITIHLSSSQRFVVIAFGVCGGNTAAPFGVTSAATASATSNTPSVTFTKNSANNLVIGALYAGNTPTVTTGSGFSTIAITASGTITGACESLNTLSAGSQTVTYSISTSKPWAIIADSFVPSIAGSTLSVSANTVTSTGTVQSILFSGASTSTVTSSGGQVATVFSVNAGTIPSLGCVQIVLTAPSSNGINIQWGNGAPTNIQLALTYG